MDARGTGTALFAAAAALSDSRVPGPDGLPRRVIARGSVYCNRVEDCCDFNCWPSIIVTFFLVIFFVLMMLICICKYCIRFISEAEWGTRSERRPLLLPPPPPRGDAPPPYHAVAHAAYLPSYEESMKTHVQQV